MGRLRLTGQQAPSTPPPSRGQDLTTRDLLRFPRAWWRNETLKLRLSESQVKAIEAIFQAHIKEARRVHEELQQSFAELTRQLRDSSSNAHTVELFVDRVTSLESRLVKIRLTMLFRMSRVLDQDQNEKLHKLRPDLKR